MLGWIALLLTLVVALSIVLRIDDWSRDWTQNTATLRDDARREDLRPLRLDTNVADTAQRIQSWVDDQSHWNVVSRSSDQAAGTTTMHLTRSTAVLRFVDDVHVTIRPNAGGGTTVVATSESRIGKGDLGQNPRNLVELVRGLRPE